MSCNCQPNTTQYCNNNFCINIHSANSSYTMANSIKYLFNQHLTGKPPTKKELLSTEVYDFLQDIKLQIFNHLPDDTELTMNEVLHQIEKMIKMRSFL